MGKWIVFQDDALVVLVQDLESSGFEVVPVSELLSCFVEQSVQRSGDIESVKYLPSPFAQGPKAEVEDSHSIES